MSATVDAIAFKRALEPHEHAFSVLVPSDWRVEGGIQRANPMADPQNVQNIAARVDFAIKRDEHGTVMMRWLPDLLYCDMRYSPAGQMGLFPPGSLYMGMLVCPALPAEQFFAQALFPQLHPQAQQPRVIEQRRLPQLAERYRQRQASLPIPVNFAYDAAVITFCYVEAGIQYQERAFAVIENMGPLAGGMWGNKETVILRAPSEEFASCEPVLSHIQNSVQLDPEWLAQEISSQQQRSQMFATAQQASIHRDRQMLRVQQEVQEIDRQIVAHRQQTNAEIQNEMFLNLTGQEEYVNPYTNKVEIAAGEWQNRWVNAGGDEFYTDDASADPNLNSLLDRSDWQRSLARER